MSEMVERVARAMCKQECEYPGITYSVWDDSLSAIDRNKYRECARAAIEAIPLERYEDALRQIRQWADAYPAEVFPEPDLNRAQDLLEAGGMTLGEISASNMRHVLGGVRRIVDAALSEEAK